MGVLSVGPKMFARRLKETDLHHANILFSLEKEWIAIDPKGLSGDPGYEVGSFMLLQGLAQTQYLF